MPAQVFQPTADHLSIRVSLWTTHDGALRILAEPVNDINLKRSRQLFAAKTSELRGRAIDLPVDEFSRVWQGFRAGVYAGQWGNLCSSCVAAPLSGVSSSKLSESFASGVLCFYTKGSAITALVRVTVQLEFGSDGEVQCVSFCYVSISACFSRSLLAFRSPVAVSQHPLSTAMARLGPVVGQLFAITLQPKLYGISLNYSQIGQVSSPSATDCKGTAVSTSTFTYGTTDMTVADIQPTTGRLSRGTWNRNTGGGIADYTTCNPTNKSGQLI